MTNPDRPLGPAPAAPGGGLSGARAAVLDALSRSGEPTTLATLSRSTGLHINTLRQHLDHLHEDGLVARERSTPTGRGRPAWRYQPTGARHGDAGTEYAGLATALAAVVTRTSSAPATDALAAGQDWGRALVQARGWSDDGVTRSRLIRLLADMGFAPEPAPAADATDSVGAATMRLTRCPLLDAARAAPEVVCSVHQGLLLGASRALGGSGSAALIPFAEPGACLVELPR